MNQNLIFRQTPLPFYHFANASFLWFDAPLICCPFRLFRILDPQGRFEFMCSKFSVPSHFSFSDGMFPGFRSDRFDIFLWYRRYQSHPSGFALIRSLLRSIHHLFSRRVDCRPYLSLRQSGTLYENRYTLTHDNMVPSGICFPVWAPWRLSIFSSPVNSFCPSGKSRISIFHTILGIRSYHRYLQDRSGSVSVL